MPCVRQADDPHSPSVETRQLDVPSLISPSQLVWMCVHGDFEILPLVLLPLWAGCPKSNQFVTSQTHSKKIWWKSVDEFWTCRFHRRTKRTVANFILFLVLDQSLDLFLERFYLNFGLNLVICWSPNPSDLRTILLLKKSPTVRGHYSWPEWQPSGSGYRVVFLQENNDDQARQL